MPVMEIVRGALALLVVDYPEVAPDDGGAP
jgi:hypothetical protein